MFLIIYCRVNFDLFTFSADGFYCVEMESGEEVHKVQELDEVENNNLEEDIGKFRILKLKEKIATLHHIKQNPSP